MAPKLRSRQIPDAENNGPPPKRLCISLKVASDSLSTILGLEKEKAPDSPPLTPENEEVRDGPHITQGTKGAPDSTLLAPEREIAPDSPALTPENEEVRDGPPITQGNKGAPESTLLAPEREIAPDSPVLTPENEEVRDDHPMTEWNKEALDSALLVSEREIAPDSPALTPENEEVRDDHPMTEWNKEALDSALLVSETENAPDSFPPTDEELPDSRPYTSEQQEALGGHTLTQGNEYAPSSPLSSPPPSSQLGDVADSTSFTSYKEATPESSLLTPESTAFQPSIWSITRGGIYETLPYYRAYKGGLYTNKLVAKGFLIDKQKEVRDYLGAQVIIASLGGGRKADAKGDRVRVEDAKDDGTIYKAMENTRRDGKPVGLILGEDYPDHPAPKDGPEETRRRPYAVLDFFRITDLWKESVITENIPLKIWKVRFEKINLDAPSWWAPGAPLGIPTDNVPPPTRQCGVCGQVSKEIFTAGWVCLNHKCANHFTVVGDRAVPGDMTVAGDMTVLGGMAVAAGLAVAGGLAVAVNDLAYTKEFLDHRTRVECEIPAEWTELRNHPPAGGESHGTEKADHGGFHCEFCGCCSRRLYWNKLVCENPVCGAEKPANMKALPESVLGEELAKFNEKMLNKNNRVNTGKSNQQWEPLACTLNWTFPIASHTFAAGNYTGVRQYFLPKPGGGIAGSFTLISSNAMVNQAPNGPDALFRQLESQDIKLKRNPAAVVGNKLEGLTRHYQRNFGAKYKFGVQVDSEGFAEAPAPVLFCVHRLDWVKRVSIFHARSWALSNGQTYEGISEEVGDFNELLALGFMEDDSINFHDDGESDLGPAVAALSLGSPSVMSFRPKYGNGKKTPVHQFAEYGLPASTAVKKLYSSVLEVPFRHGDVMVMHGKDIQKFYEHAVVPEGMRRFSMTCRTIELAGLSEEERADAVLKGAMPADCSKYEYQGW